MKNTNELIEFYDVLIIVLTEQTYKSKDNVLFEKHGFNNVKLTIGKKEKIFTDDLNDIYELIKFVNDDLTKIMKSNKIKKMVNKSRLVDKYTMEKLY